MLYICVWLFILKYHLDTPYFYAYDRLLLKKESVKILPCFISIIFTLFLIMAHFMFILLQFCSLQCHDNKKMTIQSEMNVFGSILALSA